MAVKWRCWYDDGTERDSVNHKFIDLPVDGFQIRMLYFPDVGREIQMGMDYYFEADHKTGEIIYATGNNLEDIQARYTDPIIKLGRWAPPEFYKNLIIMAMDSRSP